MSVRKVFSNESGKELSYHVGSDGRLMIEITMGDGTIANIALDGKDAIQLIQELNKVRKDLR